MKRFVFILLAVLLVFGVVSCSSRQKDVDDEAVHKIGVAVYDVTDDEVIAFRMLASGTVTEEAYEAVADVVFMTSEMDAIPQAIDIARATSQISWQNVYFALAVKVIVMVAGLSGSANMWVAVFADTGVSVLCLLDSIRILYRK